MFVEIKIKPGSRKVNPARMIIGVCDHCQEEFSTNWTKQVEQKFLSPNKNHFCSPRCVNESQRSGIINKRKKEYFQEKYGSNSPFGHKDVQALSRQTCLERHGNEIPSKTEHIRAKASAKLKVSYHDPETIAKKEATCLKRYGTKKYMSSEHAKKSRQKTLLENYGVTVPFQSEKIKQQAIEKHIEKYGCANPQQRPEIVQKTQATTLKRHGVTCVFQKPENIAKQQAAMILNATNLTSKPEEAFYQCLLIKFSEDDITRQYWINEHRWLIDFYIKSIDTFIQFDGTYWHGLNEPIEVIRESSAQIDVNRAAAYDRDRFQDEWFKSQNKRLIRITDAEFDEQGEVALETLV